MKEEQVRELIKLLEELQKGQSLDMRGSRGYSVAHPHLRKQNPPGYGKMNKYESETEEEIPTKEPVEVSRAFKKKEGEDE